MSIQTFVCETCKATFSRRPREGRAHRYCSVTCRGIGSRVDLATRFWAKVKKTDGCWYWTGSIRKDGYGNLGVDGKTQRAHRVAYKLAYGVDLGGNLGIHTCDNRSCVRPDHIVPGTDADNIHDMFSKGRAYCQKNPEAFAALNIRIPNAKKEAICAAYKNGEGSTRALAKRFGVGKTQVAKIVRHALTAAIASGDLETAKVHAIALRPLLGFMKEGN